jgi:lipopolysaccharide assembly outer membrane protein LptD (OstA)
VDLLAECRFGFPKPLQEETELSLELMVGKNTKSVESELHTKRNDQRLNSHNRVMLENWRANVDLQVIVDERLVQDTWQNMLRKENPDRNQHQKY